MRICIPTETADGKSAKVYGHFGSTPYFTIYDSKQNNFEIIKNSNLHHLHGTCHPMGVLDNKSIDAVVCGGMGTRAVQKLNEGGIKAYRTTEGIVEEIIRNYKNGKLQEITVENSCIQHDCH
ncbi:MAG: NifB/NifX family molybdenum-iron cluster-binding protein [bacterium]